MHDNLIKGEKVPRTKEISQVMRDQSASFDCGEVQAAYSMLSALLSLTVESPDAKRNTLGLIELFSPEQASKLAKVACVVETMASERSSKRFLVEQMTGVPLKARNPGSSPSV